MTPEQLRQQRVRSFFQLAQEELAVALAIKAQHHRQAAYFLQQCVEKLLRGVLEMEQVPAGTMHNIRGLVDLLPQGHMMAERFLELDVLSPAATRYRYPGPKGTVADFDKRQFDVLVPKIEALMQEVERATEDFLGPD
ncbi:HEPN domain-containing protein [Rhizobium sp. SSA_523]|uniref:HEPN domain-containing protein n=1 Tax=Rhizobium sp. SSA_523 TaxID=2952477 RepID=UPI0020917269|nr:HEPN domain-containing protein [Rhizobium sp. SSA_523]MCO5729936.1 HEPN domain-containing protein [Rhizobium sp. SSA_523]WKC25016.1 HEPN domain-containing protein [Rhizobium sp. SSA_523]